MSAAAADGCDAVDGAFDLWTVAFYTGPGGQLIISNGIPIMDANTNYLTVGNLDTPIPPIPLPASAWLVAPAVLAAGRFARRRKAA
ncbi:MAG: hypothetical protein IT486_11310 [Gammaproteobacteria bacterium]|nr:hypothetical protein [Gammaproteobacteria bacterium]